VVWNIPVACNRATADFLISSPLMDSDYERIVPDFAEHQTRLKKIPDDYGSMDSKYQGGV